MKVTILGASGRTGAHLLHRALAAGHEVTAVVRNPTSISVDHPRLRVVAGDVTNVASMIEAIEGTDAVCSVLGSGAPRRPTTLYSSSVATVIDAMHAVGVRRIVVVTAIPAEPDTLKTFVERAVVHPVLHVFFGGGYDDMVRMEQLIRDSDTDWTVVRPPRLTNSPPKNRYSTAVDERLKHAAKIARADLALAVLDMAADRSAIRHSINIAS
jgi:putative NADH-flavin reductase